jgi:ribonuclease BN (tRNA processing enzyme)
LPSGWTWEGKALVYTGDTTLCDPLLRLVQNVHVIVTECSCAGVSVHLGPDGVQALISQAPNAQVIVTHLDGHDHPSGFDGLHVAQDLGRFSF